MFVTIPQFEVAGLSALAAAGQKYWRAVTAEFPVQPWYIFVYEGQLLDARVNLAALIAWEESLIELVERVPDKDRRAVYRVDPHRSGLTFKTVQALWAPAAGDGDGVGAIIAFEDDGKLVDPTLHQVPQDRKRRLVFKAHPPRYPGSTRASEA